MAALAKLVPAIFRPAPALDAGGFAATSRLATRAELNRPGMIAAWDALASRAAEPNPFFESWYLLPALEAHDPRGRVGVLCCEVGGDLVGLLPVLRAPRYYRWPLPHLAGWTHPNCFLGAPLVAQGAELAFWRALLDWADRHAGSALFLHLPDIPLQGSLHAALARVLGEQQRPSALVARHERAMLASELSPEAYFELSVPGKKRKELRRQFARLAEQGSIAIDRREGTAGLAGWLDDFLELEQAGWKGKAGSALATSPATARLFREAMRGAAERGRLERLSLTLDGRPIAMLATFLTAPGSFSFKTAFDESLSRYSPGVLLQRENLALLERDGIDWCDSCAAADHPMIERIWREKRGIGRLSVAIGGPLRRALFQRLAAAELRRSPIGSQP